MLVNQKQFQNFIKRTLIILVSLVTLPVWGNDFFRLNRNDQLVPEHCLDVKLSHFSNMQDMQFVVFGIQDSSSRGFTNEYPLDRDEFAFLYEVMKPGHDITSRELDIIHQHPGLKEAYEIAMQYKDIMGFDMCKEGDILEILALVELKKIYPEPEYYVTGGVEYHPYKNGQTIGEVDIIVAESSTCKAIVIGETKLGVKSYGFARSQIQRFRNFIQNNLRRYPNQ